MNSFRSARVPVNVLALPMRIATKVDLPRVSGNVGKLSRQRKHHQLQRNGNNEKRIRLSMADKIHQSSRIRSPFPDRLLIPDLKTFRPKLKLTQFRQSP
jgi:hypothetical protein